MLPCLERAGWRTGCSLRGPFLLFAAVFFTFTASAQLGIKILQFRPTGELGAVMERKVSAELMYMDDFEEDFRFRAFVGYLKLEPRLDVFPTVGYEYRDGQWTVFPGTFTYTKYTMIMFGGGLDYAAVRLMDDRLTIYPGFRIFGGGVNQEYESTGLSSSGFSGGKLMAGIGGQLGVDYQLTDQLGFFAEYGTATHYVEEDGRFTFNDMGLGARYTF